MNNSKRWLYLGMATITLLFLGLIYAWSIFKAPLSEIYPDWSVSQMSLTFTISMCCFCLGGFVGGLISKKLSVRVRFFMAAVMLFIGFFAVSTLNAADSAASLTKLYIFYGVFGGGGVGFAYNIVLGTVNKWFPDKVGLASGVMLMGFGLGGLALGSVINTLIGKIGLMPTFKLIGIAIAVVCVLAALIIKAPNEGQSAALAKMAAFAAKKKGAEEEKDASAVEMTPGEMLKTAKFWIFVLWTIFLNSAGLLVINSAANIAVAFGGTAVIGMLVSLFNGAGRIVAGTNFDKNGRKIATFVNTLFMLLAGVVLSIGGLTGKLVFVVIGLVFVGLSYGGCPTLTSAYINRAFGAKNYATNFSIANFSLIPAATIGPMISSKLLVAAEGSYNTNFYAIIAFTAVSLVLWVVLNITAKDEK